MASGVTIESNYSGAFEEGKGVESDEIPAYLKSKGALEIEAIRQLSGMPCEQCD